MKMSRRLNKSIITLALALCLGGVSSTSAFAKTNLAALNDELEIMSNILKTTLSQGDKEVGIQVRGLDATYLAKQGVVFEVSTRSRLRHFTFEFSGDSEFLVVPPIPPVPSAHHDIGDHDNLVFSFDSDEWEEVAEHAMEQAHEAMREARSQLRELRGQEREYAWEERNLERRIRDLDFEMRNADKDRLSELREQKKEVEQELKEIKSRQQEVDKVAAKLEKEQKQKAAEKLAARQKQYNAFLAQFENKVADSLCKFGNGLKALSEDENVTFILSNFGSKESSGRQDKIYVFGNKDIQSCVRDKLSMKQLLSKADSYTF